MKKIMVGAIGVLFLGALTLWFMGKETRTITTQIEISAAPEKVWDVLTNIAAWKEWSPIIKDSSGSAKSGSKLTITMVSDEGKDGKPGPKYEPTVTTFDEAKNMTWTATMGPGFVMTNGKVFELQATETGTLLIHKETFSGMMVPMMWSKVQQNVPKMLDSMNEALKKLVEES